jgi:hypothetical protein
MKAFPSGYIQAEEYRGMDLRDYFAAKAMQKMIWEKGQDLENAKECYAIADAMMKARTE